MDRGVEIRAASSHDAVAIARVLRRSIRQLCLLDHRNDKQTLDLWLAYKKASIVRRWLQNRNAQLLIGCVDGRIACVGAFTHAGHVTLNYVDPDFRFLGVSKRMMEAIEQRARDIGLKRLTLESTLTAQRFYEGMGFSPTGPYDRKHGIVNQPMEKEI